VPSQVEANKVVIRELFAKALTNREVSAFAAYVEPDAVQHVKGNTQRFDIGSFRLALGGLASSNITCAIEDVIGEAEWVDRLRRNTHNERIKLDPKAARPMAARLIP